MSEELEKIYQTYKYAKDNNIDPADPSTWNDSYKKRQMELAGIISTAENQIQQIKEGIEKSQDND